MPPDAEPSHEQQLELGIEGFEWDDECAHESIRQLYRNTVAFAKRKIFWYSREAEKNSKLAKRMRLVIIVLLTIGGMCPLIDATRSFDIRLTSWGYVVFAVVTGLYLVDHFYGFSKSWMRSTVTWLSLREGLAGFYCDWVRLAAQCSDTPTSPDHAGSIFCKQLESLRDFRLKIEKQIAFETKEWVGELEKALAEQQSAAEKSKGPKTGLT
jgi:hypothetical protein